MSTSEGLPIRRNEHRKSSLGERIRGIMLGPRELTVGPDMVVPDDYPTNYIKTAKYSLLTFLPVAIMQQFRRLANFYFLITAIVQSVPAISTLNPVSAIAPFLFIICISLIKEGVEDYGRYKSDKETNATPARRWKAGHETPTTWANIKVGDILVIHENEFIPADCVPIRSSNETGSCYIETSSLDGEKNLKPKLVLTETQHVIQLNSELPAYLTISAEEPTPSINSFEGSMVVRRDSRAAAPPDDQNSGSHTFSRQASLLNEERLFLTVKQLLLRGAVLRNTKWVIAVVIYTGWDTKIMKNAEANKYKQSQIEHSVNRFIVYILIFQLICSAIIIGFAVVFMTSYQDDHWYLPVQETPGFSAVLLYFGYFLLLNTMIPISLIVTLEVTRIVQGLFITADRDFYNAEKARGAKVVTSSINEELGQVEYVFSDKTGTLTCNVMEFKNAVIGEELYGQNNPDNKSLGANFNFYDVTLVDLMKTDDISVGPTTKELKLYDSKGVDVLAAFTTQKEIAEEYWRALSICHQCVVDFDETTGNMKYQGNSPDEITLVDAARYMGHKFLGGTSQSVIVEVRKNRVERQLLNVFEFDSDRKRMSVIVRDRDKIKLYTKGADAIIKARLCMRREQPYLKKIDEYIDEFAKKGLRTLMVAMKVLTEQEYEQFSKQYQALAKVENREKKIALLADEIETNLYLIGATAVEDRLQDNVPETIADLLRANIKVWMLTGDKLETAENIARSCQLISPETTVLTCRETNATIVARFIEFNDTIDLCIQQGRSKALLIEGESLAVALANKKSTQAFLKASTRCEAVVCCRVTPKQKAEVVRLVKTSLNKITLAIGDGANDVNMIQEANIGVGIFGNEGMRAVQASDFALPEFQGLWKLLLVHGRWSYIRIAEMILYFFYKNMVFTMPQFFFAFHCAFSGQTVFDSWYLSFYNMIFTAFPLAVRAILEQDINYKKRCESSSSCLSRTVPLDSSPRARRHNISLSSIEGGVVTISQPIKSRFPMFYDVGQKNKIFNLKKLVQWLVYGTSQAVVLYFACFWVFNEAILDSEGHNSDYSAFSLTLYTAVFLIVTMKLLIFTRHWNSLTYAILVLAFLLYFGFMWAYDGMIWSDVMLSVSVLYTSTHFYLTLALILGVYYMIDIFLLVMQREINPTLVDYFRLIFNSEMFNNEEFIANIEDEITPSTASSFPLFHHIKTPPTAPTETLRKEFQFANSLNNPSERHVDISSEKHRIKDSHLIISLNPLEHHVDISPEKLRMVPQEKQAPNNEEPISPRK